MIDPADIRNLSISAGAEVRAQVERLPDSADKREFLRITAQLEDFWRAASDDFVLQFLDVALAVDHG